MRLTTKGFNYNAPILNKLANLEDIEDELGIDLITLFKALRNGIYLKHDNNIEYAVCTSFNDEFIYASIIVDDEGTYIPKILLIKDYGGKWSLNEEDLK